MAQVLLAAVLVLGLLEPARSSSHGSGPHWAYTSSSGVLGPNDWSRGYEHCGGYRQSPININTYAAEYNSYLTEFDLNDYDKTPRSMTLKNVGGHTVEVELPEYPEILISGGALNGEYRLAQFHFHWGQRDSRGSEHQVNGRPAPLEMHMVHTRPSAYKNWKPELAVLSFLFEVGSHNRDFDRFLNYFDNVRYSDQEKHVSPFAVSHLLPNNAGFGVYYRYYGSLTTPPCSETVVWTVFKDRIPISSSQLRRFRSLRSGPRPADDDTEVAALQDNFRPLQNLYGRHVYTNEGRGGGGGSHSVHRRSAHHSGSHSHPSAGHAPPAPAAGGHGGHTGQGSSSGHTGDPGHNPPTTPSD